MKEAIQTGSGAAPTGSYSQAIRAGDFVFVSGQGPLDPQTGAIIGTTIEEQTQRTLENIKAIVEAAGGTVADIVKVSAHLADLSEFDRFDRVYGAFFAPPRPARITVGSELDDILVEIDAVAYVPRREEG